MVGLESVFFPALKRSGDPSVGLPRERVARSTRRLLEREDARAIGGQCWSWNGMEKGRAANIRALSLFSHGGRLPGKITSP